MSAWWPWIAIAGLGAFHGLNPAMGWLFAVALGLNRGDGRVVALALPPIALGHALSIALAALAVLALGAVIDLGALRPWAGALLIGWAAWHAVYGHRHRVRVGLSTGMAGLVLWSFLMAGAHGAGVMLLPALIPLCTGPSPAGGTLATGLAAVGLHTLAMLAVTGALAGLVYRWLGIGVIRKSWVNFDLLWTGMLTAAGLWLIAAA